MVMPLALIVEDDNKVAAIFATVLRLAEYETTIAPDGLSALGYLERTIPDLVVLDLHLPQASGVEILTYIRQEPRLAQVPVILATADVRMAEILAADADLVLLKPVSPAQLRGLAYRLRPQGLPAPHPFTDSTPYSFS